MLVNLLQDLGKKSWPELKKEVPGLIKGLPPALHSLALLRDPNQGENFYREGGDNSNTQFALLALWAARNQKLPLDPTLQLVVRRFRNSQTANGSWHAGIGHGSDPVLDSCFALLFLQRANLAQDLTDKLQELLGTPAARFESRDPFRRDA